MKAGPIVAVLFATGLSLGACQNSSAPGRSDTIRFVPPSTEFAVRLGIAPPITAEEAMSIAAEAAGGTAISVTEETECGELLFEVIVSTSSGRKEVEVRASDGAVVEIEPDDGSS